MEQLPLPYRAVMDAAADMIWMRDLRTGELLDVNKAVEERLGWTRAELLGRSVAELYAEDAQRSFQRFSDDIVTRGRALAYALLKTKSGTRIKAELRGSRLDWHGEPAALVIARDMGAEARDRRAELAVYEAFRRSNDVMFYCDRGGVILDVNDAFCRRYGYKRAEVIGQTPRILRSRHSTDELYQSMWSSILDPKKGFWRGEMINRAKDGQEIPLILTITAVRDASGQIVGYVSNAVDMTEQQALQQRLAHTEALASLGEMAAVVAHEIRNPLGSIVMASRQLATDQLDAEDRDAVIHVLRAESQRLNEVLSSFLNYARPRDLKTRRTDLDALVREVCAMASPAVQVHAGGLKPVPVDGDQIRQVVWNLVTNALQAVEGKGKVAVSTGRQPGWVYVSVADDGPGIPADQLNKIFKPFHTTKRQGTGLGLPIAERIARAHGGRIEASNGSKGGATFTLWLPSAEA